MPPKTDSLRETPPAGNDPNLPQAIVDIHEMVHDIHQVVLELQYRVKQLEKGASISPGPADVDPLEISPYDSPSTPTDFGPSSLVQSPDALGWGTEPASEPEYSIYPLAPGHLGDPSWSQGSSAGSEVELKPNREAEVEPEPDTDHPQPLEGRLGHHSLPSSGQPLPSSRSTHQPRGRRRSGSTSPPPEPTDPESTFLVSAPKAAELIGCSARNFSKVGRYAKRIKGWWVVRTDIPNPDHKASKLLRIWPDPLESIELDQD